MKHHTKLAAVLICVTGLSAAHAIGLSRIPPVAKPVLKIISSFAQKSLILIKSTCKNKQVNKYLITEFKKDGAFAEKIMDDLLGKNAKTVIWEINPRSAPDEAGGVTKYLGEKIICEIGENVEVSKFKTLAFHENGHAVFYQYRTAFALQTERERLLAQKTVFAAKKRLEQIGGLGKDYFSRLTPEEKTAFRIVELNKRSIIAYHELIADTFSVTINKTSKVGNRDFSNLNNLHLATKDIHHYFNEVRYYLWRNYLKDRINDEPYAAEILKRLVKAANEEAEALYKTIKHNYFNLGDLDLEPSKVLDKLKITPCHDANMNLIKRFESLS